LAQEGNWMAEKGSCIEFSSSEAYRGIPYAILYSIHDTNHLIYFLRGFVWDLMAVFMLFLVKNIILVLLSGKWSPQERSRMAEEGSCIESSSSEAYWGIPYAILYSIHDTNHLMVNLWFSNIRTLFLFEPLFRTW